MHASKEEKEMCKRHKRWIYPLLLTVAFLLTVRASVPFGSVYGSTTDWFSQHEALAETIRAECIGQKTLLPSFLPLGGGSNGFMFSYYGYLRPDIVAGCLLPWVSMRYLMTGYLLAVYLVSVLLFYRLLLCDGKDAFMAFWGSMLFLFAACFFHMHRQVMFINYMPYLLAALLMVKKKRYAWIPLFLTLLYCSSFYYAPSSLAALGWYWYREEGKSFFARYVKATVISVGMAAALLIPTGLVILEHRRGGAGMSAAGLLEFREDLSSLLYTPYGMGLTAVSLYALFLGVAVKRLRADSVCYICVAGFQVVSWILNGTLYARSKILIPFMPLVLLHCVRTLGGLAEIRRVWRFAAFVPLLGTVLCSKSRERMQWLAADAALLFLVILISSKSGLRRRICLVLLVLPACFYFMTAQTEQYVDREIAEELSADLTEAKEQTFGAEGTSALYRSDSIYEPLNTANRYLSAEAVWGTGKSTMYSSVTNKAYEHVYYDLLMTPIQINNRIALLAADNPFLLHFFGVRYVQTAQECVPDGYRIVEAKGKLAVAENERVMPTAYLTKDIMPLEAFEELDDYAKLDALMRTTVVDGGETMCVSSGDDFYNRMQVYEPEFLPVSLPEGLSVTEVEEGVYDVEVKKESHMTWTFAEPLKEEILLLSFRVENQTAGAVVIDINQIRNKLSAKSAAYPNGNKRFCYQFSESDGDGLSQLETVFTKGKYRITDVQWHTYRKDLLYQREITQVQPHQREGSTVFSCTAKAQTDCLFVTSIPRQDGMKLLVDGESVPICTVNTAFVGAWIPAGSHEIDITFCPPGLKVGIAISILSVLIYYYIDRSNYKDYNYRRNRMM